MNRDENFPKESPESGVPVPGTPPPRPGTEMVETREQFIERALAEYESPLIGYAYGFVRDLDRARDVVQDTFIRLCRQDVEKVRDGLKSWLFTVCRNRALDVLRKESRMGELNEDERGGLPSEAIGPDDEADRNERVAEVMRYLDRLSENQKTVILMKFRDGLSYHEICEQTGLSNGNVGFLIHAGLKRLRSILPPDLFDSQ
ncbi:RNA polymerase sigma factor [Haloferula sp. A504]|uniref:RNA polymerase sigma factor n=1 Tax=Haloferula sp. A504 TaxID=3373601 RepID=UPI0031C8B15C|nr:sigma-70 family RNA polymerase sigma factor [Verrucomicrobiaceae bacterium E54]